MKIYHYNAEGIYVGDGDARIDPLDTDRHLIPANATPLAPAVARADKERVFDGSKWTFVDDYRGAKYWTAEGVEMTIHLLGDVVPADALSAAPEVPLADRIKSAIAEVNGLADSATQKFTSGLPASRKAEYENAERQSDLLLAEVDPDNPVGLYKALDVDLKVGTIDPRTGAPVASLRAAAEVVLLTRDLWFSKLDDIRDVRKVANSEISKATTLLAVDQVIDGLVWPGL